MERRRTSDGGGDGGGGDGGGGGVGGGGKKKKKRGFKSKESEEERRRMKFQRDVIPKSMLYLDELMMEMEEIEHKGRRKSPKKKGKENVQSPPSIRLFARDSNGSVM